MRSRPFGRLGEVSALTLGGGGIGQVWGRVDRAEAVATLRAAVDAGITLIDLAPSYGAESEAEQVFGAAFEGRLPAGVRLTTKCLLLAPDAADVYARLSESLEASLRRLRVENVDIFFLHGMLLPPGWRGDARGTPVELFEAAVRPAFERLVAEGKARAWGISAVGVPEAVVRALNSEPRPFAAQCIANLLESPGGMKRYEGSARSREIIGVAKANGVAVMGIRAVQAGALTDAFDRPIPDDSPEMADYERAAPFRAIAGQLGMPAAYLAHRYALSLAGVDTVVLGVKNRDELAECLRAEADGPLEPDLIRRLERAVGSAAR